VKDMGNNLARQLVADHLVEGEMRPGEEIALRRGSYCWRIRQLYGFADMFAGDSGCRANAPPKEMRRKPFGRRAQFLIYVKTGHPVVWFKAVVVAAPA
jgi:hypothetical protein